MARKSRVITETQKQENAKSFVWKIGIYIRLSKEDLRNNDESESVTNQRKINLEFVEEKFCNEKYIIYDIYVDDGRSGTTEDTRPDFQRLSKDIREGNVNCVICKLSPGPFVTMPTRGSFWNSISLHTVVALSHLAIPMLIHLPIQTVCRTWKSR